jgi:hypothetical protein
MLGYKVDDQWFKSQQGLGIFLFTTTSRLALGPTQPPIQWVPEALSLGVKQPGHEADHSFPSSAEVKNVWSYTSTPQYAFKAWYSVKKHKDLKKSEKNIISYFIYKSKANQDRAIYQHKKPEMMMKITPGEIYLFLLDKFFSSLPPVANFVL